MTLPDISLSLTPITMTHVLLLSGLVFTIGVFGLFFNRRNILLLLMALEIMLLAVNINFIGFAAQMNDLAGQMFVLFILTVAAAEAGVGLSILVAYFRSHGDIDVNDLSELKG